MGIIKKTTEEVLYSKSQWGNGIRNWGNYPQSQTTSINPPKATNVAAEAINLTPSNQVVNKPITVSSSGGGSATGEITSGSSSTAGSSGWVSSTGSAGNSSTSAHSNGSKQPNNSSKYFWIGLAVGTGVLLIGLYLYQEGYMSPKKPIKKPKD